MVVPPWLTFLVAGTVIVFGLYRIRLAFRSDEEDARARQRKGLYARPRRTHALFGVLYLLLGGILIAGVLGYAVNPLRLIAPEPAAPEPAAPDDAVPVQTVVPPAETPGG